MAGGVGFIRVKLLQVEKGSSMDSIAPMFDPYVAVNVKESVQTPGRGIQQVQKKRTIYPEWNTCFDAHLYDGRVINLVVMEKPNRFLAEITLSAKVLAEKCTDGNIATAWDTFKVKNAGSWSSLANMSTPSSQKKGPSAMQSFEQFKKAAKQKEERDKMMKEQEEKRKFNKEMEERNRQRSEMEKLREREEEEALDAARKSSNDDAARQREADRKAKEIERRKEQERRRREAMANRIDMNAQSDLMASFEEMM
ncbi:unnamed protein product [Mytilus edulis]|uniref:Bromodomain protein 4 C-terminal domain-containing protein n=1 Tax=Mytilus edulis TaxID=6550 RepID=A0A8S3V0A0_MYTED|nr:unnamed protein product [Mytilus edulis]